MIICAAAVTLGTLLLYHGYQTDPSSSMCTLGVILLAVGQSAGCIIESEQRDKNKKRRKALVKKQEVLIVS